MAEAAKGQGPRGPGAGERGAYKGAGAGGGGAVNGQKQGREGRGWTQAQLHPPSSCVSPHVALERASAALLVLS